MSTETPARLMREMAVLTALAFTPFVGVPAIVHAQEAEIRPFSIEGSLELSRGSITPSGADTFVFAPEDTCTIAISEWGWGSCDHIDAFVVQTTPDTDSVLIEKPDSGGYVTFDDWNEADLEETIALIEEAERASAAEQSRRLGYPVTFEGWRMTPTLDRGRQIMYYSTDWAFAGERVTSVTVRKFDRRGYVTFDIMPYAQDPDAAALTELVHANLALYAPAPNQDYAAFTSGDKVAAVGALGLLGALFGVKYSKGIGGLIATALIFAKKFGVFAVMALVGIGSAIGRLFGGKRDA